MAIQLTPKTENFEGPAHELYVKINKLLERLEDVRMIEAYGVLAYIQHELLHKAYDVQDEE